MDVRKTRLSLSLIVAATLPLACDFAPLPDFVNWESPHVHPIDLTPDGSILLTVSTPDNRLELFSVSDAGLFPLGSIPVGLDPVSVRARSNTEAWVVNHISDSVSVVNLESRQVVATLSVGDEPCDVVFAGNPQRAFVSISQENRVRVYNPDDLAAAPASIDIEGEDPRAMAVSSDGSRVYAAIFESGNATTLVPHQGVSSEDGPYAGQNPPPNVGMDFFPQISPGAENPPRVGQIVRKVDGLWIDINGADWSSKISWDVCDHDVAIIDADSLQVTYAVGLMTLDMGLAVHPSGDVTVIGSEALNDVRFEPNLRGDFARMVMAVFDPLAPDGAVVHDLNPHLDYSLRSIPAGERPRAVSDPRGIVWNAAGDRAYVTGMGTDNVIVMNQFGERLADITVPAGPTGLVLDESRDRLYVISKFSAGVTVIDTDDNAVARTLPIFDPSPAAIKDGRPHLYNATKSSAFGHLSCASCHVDARMDPVAWDLGDPAGGAKDLNQPCSLGVLDFSCRDWHPMKGPMTTQTLVGIIKGRPLHWRGDREDLAAFSGAFVSLLGADGEPEPDEMAQFEAFLATIVHPPNPNRLADGGLRDAMIIRDRLADAVRGHELFTTIPSDRDLLKCVDCHDLDTGGNAFLVGGRILGSPQQAVISPLGAVYEKSGFDLLSRDNTRGFGLTHDGAFDHVENFLTHRVFTVPTDQDRLDLEAFVLSFSEDTHAAVGMQVTLPSPGSNAAKHRPGAGTRLGDAGNANSGNANSIAAVAQKSFAAAADAMEDLQTLTLLRRLADERRIGLVAHGRVDGTQRGYAYIAGAGRFQSDRADEMIDFDALLELANAGHTLTWTAVPLGTETRIGIDRDNDGLLNLDDPDPSSADLVNQQLRLISR